MADKTVIIKLDVQEAGAISSIETLNNSLKKLDSTSDEYAVILKKIQVEETKLASIQKQRAGAQKSVTKALSKQKDATGSATAATMELSRVISDAPYGIRGMANNITQLVSQLGSASKKAGGFGGALKEMGKQLNGPLGIVLVVTAAVSALDFFYGTMKKATKAMSEFTNVTYAQSLVAGQYVDILEDLNTSEYDRKVAVQELIKLVPELKKEDLAYGKNLDKVRGQIALYSLAQASRIEIDKLVQDNSEILAIKNQATQIDAISNQKDRLEKMTKFISEQGEDVSGFYVGFGVEKLIEEGDVDQIEETFKRLGGVIDKESKPIMDRILELTTSLRLDPEKDKKGGSKGKGIIKLLDPKDFEGDLFEIEKMLRKFKHKELTLAAETEQQKGAVKALIELDNFKKEYSSYVESEDQKFDKFKENLEKETFAHKANLDKQLKAKKITQEEFNKADSDGQEARDTALAFAEEEFRDKSLVSYENYLKGLVAISDKYDRDIIGVGVTQFETLAEQQRKAADRVLTGKLKAFIKRAKLAKKILSSMTDFVNGEFEREMIIEQNKTNALNTELNNRLNNENLSKEQRKSIQNEIAQNDEKLRVKQEVIERKRFKMNKAANIANALMDTASAAAGVMAQAKGGFFARLAQAIPTIAFGLAQVATIARQKFQSSASKTPINTTGGGGSGSGEGRAEPSFNIVGRSDDNLLINAIQATFDKPLKAYVVSRDVTNQQQLDGIITDQAGT